MRFSSDTDRAKARGGWFGANDGSDTAHDGRFEPAGCSDEQRRQIRGGLSLLPGVGMDGAGYRDGGWQEHYFKPMKNHFSSRSVGTAS